MTPDRALVGAVVRDGDEVAFRELYRRHTPRLYPFVLRVVGGGEMDAEDVVQETWIRATAGMRRFRGDSSFATWLTAIGLNAARDHVRRHCRRFIEIYVATPLDECERRDTKGLYARARRGELGHFTGVSDPYEPPEHAELVLDTTGISVATAVERVLAVLGGTHQ